MTKYFKSPLQSAPQRGMNATCRRKATGRGRTTLRATRFQRPENSYPRHLCRDVAAARQHPRRRLIGSASSARPARTRSCRRRPPVAAASPARRLPSESGAVSCPARRSTAVFEWNGLGRGAGPRGPKDPDALAGPRPSCQRARGSRRRRRLAERKQGRIDFLPDRRHHPPYGCRGTARRRTTGAPL